MTGAGGTAFAHAHRLTAPVFHVSVGSVSSSCAIGEAFQKIAAGLLDVVVVGGAECPLQGDIIESFRVGGVLAAPCNGAPACFPFDARRTGTVLGEGAGVLILEAAEHAADRGARPRAVVTGFGLSRETYSMIRPDPTGVGVAQAASTALRGVRVEEIGWIKTHGTGTVLNDAAECRGLAAAFGDRFQNTPLVSLKSTLGHCLGACGAVETVAAVLALERGVVPATLGTSEVDPSLPACCVPRHTGASGARRVLLVAAGFGGRCAAMTISRP
jgi:3-oxoacyl-[acyl-carrier-protein] synthase II